MIALATTERWRVDQGDCMTWLRSLPDDYASLLLCSPPYEAARTYGIGFKLRGQAWVDWMVEVVTAAAPKVNGLIAVVCEGQTRGFRYSAVPMLLMADLHRAGFNLRKPPAYCRVGIPGSGGPDWLRNDWEPVVCVTRPGKLPWAEPTACGHEPLWAPGGPMANRRVNGKRVNKREKQIITKIRDGQRKPGPSSYTPPKNANPGNLIRCKVGGGLLGHPLAHENEAPFPLKLADLFVRSFAKPGSIVLDCFSGSGTTGHAAIEAGRRYHGCDLRSSQVELATRRLQSITPEMFAATG